ncbi:protein DETOXIFICATION 16-like isoform X1 [Cornus florida]|uniref:protein DETOXIFICATION 16-like isoform X1 n=1 Tax=Cornus florida TaxID=4283 RepID=UPI00289AAFCD|nr:protein DETOXIFICATION 16-like isoform X1 [Cornus florida]
MDEEDSSTLLESPLIHEKGHDLGGELTKKCSQIPETIAELKLQLKLAGPLVMVNFLQYSLQMISVMFVGHLGELSLSSASLATSFAGVTGFSFMMGMGSALETFCGQAHGAKQYHMLGIHMQRAMLVVVLLSIPISVLWAYSGYIFTRCGQDLEISEHAGIYARWLIPSIFPYGILQCQLRFLQTQNSVKPLMMITAFTSLVHVFVCWTLVFRVGFGNKGAALSNTISYWINVLILAIYIKFSPSCQRTWTGFSKEGMKNIVGFLSLAIPSAIMLCLEYWAFESLVLMSGLLPNPKLETSMMSISFNTCAVVFRISFGLGSAVSTRVSNELGAGKPHAARLAARVVLFLAVAASFLVGLVSVAAGDVWGYVYTNEEEVVKYLASVMPVLATSNFMDGIQAALSGIARGCGRQKIGAIVNLGAYYFVGIPCAVILTFVFDFRGKGLWMGIISGISVQALLLLAITMRTDWEQQARKARDRVNCSSIPIDMA